jgi:hypothetical protein
MNVSIGSYTFRLEIMILIVIVFWFIFGNLLCGCCRVSVFEAMTTIAKKGKEGFANPNRPTMGVQFSESKSQGYIMPPNLWSSPSVSNNSVYNAKKQPIPLPKDEMLMFASNEFKPECCPSTYSTSTGCACITVDQYKYLNERGGNNVPFSEY